MSSKSSSPSKHSHNTPQQQAWEDYKSRKLDELEDSPYWSKQKYTKRISHIGKKWKKSSQNPKREGEPSEDEKPAKKKNKSS